MVFKSTWDWFQKCEIHSNCNFSWGKWRWTINVHQCPDKPTCLVGNYDFWWLDIVHLLVSYLSTCWCPSCPLVGYCPLFGFNLQSLGVSSAKKRNCYYSHGISRTHMPDLLRNHQKHGWNPSLCCDWGACWAHCLVVQNPFGWDQWFSHGDYPWFLPMLPILSNGEEWWIMLYNGW